MEILLYGQHKDQFSEVHIPSKVNNSSQWLVLVHGVTGVKSIICL